MTVCNCRYAKRGVHGATCPAQAERIADLEARLAELERTVENALDHVAWRYDE